MYLVIDGNYYTFYHDDPRLHEGFPGKGKVVEEDVEFDYDLLGNHEWPYGTAAPEPWLGRSRKNGKLHKVFRTRESCEEEGFEPITTSFDPGDCNA